VQHYTISYDINLVTVDDETSLISTAFRGCEPPKNVSLWYLLHRWHFPTVMYGITTDLRLVLCHSLGGGKVSYIELFIELTDDIIDAV